MKRIEEKKEERKKEEERNEGNDSATNAASSSSASSFISAEAIQTLKQKNWKHHGEKYINNQDKKAINSPWARWTETEWSTCVWVHSGACEPYSTLVIPQSLQSLTQIHALSLSLSSLTIWHLTEMLLPFLANDYDEAKYMANTMTQVSKKNANLCINLSRYS